MSYVPETIDYDMYAKMDYWRFEEAIWLTISYKLLDKSFESIDNYISEYEIGVSKLTNILYRSIESGSLGDHIVVYNYRTDKLPILSISAIIPYWFVKWVISKGYDIPTEFKKIQLTEFEISDIDAMINSEFSNYMIEFGVKGLSGVLSETTNNVTIEADNRNVALSDIKDNYNHKYCFIKTTQSWNLRFGEVVLYGVKDLVGMDYIATLLKNPGTSISVIDIQAMLNPAGIKLPGSDQSAEFEGQDESPSVMDGNYARSSKSKSLENLKRRLQALSKERNELISGHDHIELEAIDNEYAKIEIEIDNIRFGKNDDPEIKKNRDKVAKAIKAAIENIRGLKTKEGYSSAPICDFLTQHIKTASECVYNPPIIDPPEWTF